MLDAVGSRSGAGRRELGDGSSDSFDVVLDCSGRCKQPHIPQEVRDLIVALNTPSRRPALLHSSGVEKRGIQRVFQGAQSAAGWCGAKLS